MVYDKKVIRRLAENNLYIKPEKYKQKVRDVGPEVIKIEEEMKEFKDVQKFLELANYY